VSESCLCQIIKHRSYTSNQDRPSNRWTCIRYLVRPGLFTYTQLWLEIRISCPPHNGGTFEHLGYLTCNISILIRQGAHYHYTNPLVSQRHYCGRVSLSSRGEIAVSWSQFEGYTANLLKAYKNFQTAWHTTYDSSCLSFRQVAVPPIAQIKKKGASEKRGNDPAVRFKHCSVYLLYRSTSFVMVTTVHSSVVDINPPSCRE